MNEWEVLQMLVYLAGAISAVGTIIWKISSLISDLSSRIDVLIDETDETKAILQTHEKSIANHDSHLGDHDKQIEKIMDEIELTQKKLGELRTEIEKLKITQGGK